MRFSSVFVAVVSVAFSANVFALPILNGVAEDVALWVSLFGFLCGQY